MKNLKLFIMALLISVLSINILVFDASALAPPVTHAKADFLMNLTTGEVYYEKNADDVRAPASLTKLMTVYMVYEALERGEITKDTQVWISKYTQRVSAMGSSIPLYYGNHYSVDELLQAVMTVSANNAACALGELLSGSESAFAANMTAESNKLGLNMKFYDASGLNCQNRVTARTMADLATLLIIKHPDILNYSSRSSINFRGKTYCATNRLLPGRGFTYSNTDGLKTGTTGTAGRCLVATSKCNGNRLLTVVLGASSDRGRYTDTINMLNYGFSRVITLHASKQGFLLNGNNVVLNSYTANGSNYVSLRDVAAILTGTEIEFSVGWDGSTKTITITSGKSECINRPEEAFHQIAGAKVSSASLLVNGEYAQIGGYVINGKHYFNIRELASLIGLNIAYDSSTNLVSLTTTFVENNSDSSSVAPSETPNELPSNPARDPLLSKYPIPPDELLQ